jgi:hypothetical protein
LVAVFDDEKEGRRFMGFVVGAPAKLASLSFDRILVTSLNSIEMIIQIISSMGISKESVVKIE